MWYVLVIVAAVWLTCGAIGLTFGQADRRFGIYVACILWGLCFLYCAAMDKWWPHRARATYE